MKYDRQGLEGRVLRFVARLDTSRPIDQDRRFILFYYLSDNTLSIFEPQQKNSGEEDNIFIIILFTCFFIYEIS